MNSSSVAPSHTATSKPDRNAEIVRLRREGVGPREIARRLDCSSGVVSGVLFRAGLTEPGIPAAQREPRPPRERKPPRVRKPYARDPITGKQIRGFAAMDPERRRAVARTGGAAQAPEKRSFSTNRDLAATAGRKGGTASRGGGRPRAVPQ